MAKTINKSKEELNKVEEDDPFSLENTKEDSTPRMEWTGIRTGINLYWTREIENPEHGTPLVELKRALKCKIHSFTKKGNNKICKKSLIVGGNDNTECEYCQEETQFKYKDKNTGKMIAKKNTPKNCLVIPMYIFNRVGKQLPKKDEEGNVIENEFYEENPEKIVIINRCQDDSNITALVDYDEAGKLTRAVLKITRWKAELKKAMTFEKDDRDLLEKKFAHCGLDVPERVQSKWDNMSRAEVWGYCINALSPDWDNETVKKYTVKPAEVKYDDDGGSDNPDLSENLDNVQ